MPNEQVGQAPTGDNGGQAPTTENVNPPAGETTKTTLSHEDAIAALERVRREAAEYRVKNKELEEKVSAAEKAKMTDLEKAQARVAELERSHAEHTRTAQERAIKYEVQLHAAKLGIIDPDAASKLLDLSQLDYDEDGTPKNAQKLLQDLVKAKPYLIGTQASGSATNPPSTSHGANTFSRAQIAAMSPEEYQTNRAAINAAMKAGRITG